MLYYDCKKDKTNNKQHQTKGKAGKMRSETRNKHLLKLLGEGYICYVPEKDRNGYSIISHKGNSILLEKIKEIAERSVV